MKFSSLLVLMAWRGVASSGVSQKHDGYKTGAGQRCWPFWTWSSWSLQLQTNDFARISSVSNALHLSDSNCLQATPLHIGEPSANLFERQMQAQSASLYCFQVFDTLQVRMKTTMFALLALGMAVLCCAEAGQANDPSESILNKGIKMVGSCSTAVSSAEGLQSDSAVGPSCNEFFKSKAVRRGLYSIQTQACPV
jgi:hypothetical protein